ncbi:helix-turn-helix DNA-binding protein [Gordonia phage Mollymur]|uniref:Helix-turn-helix DNA-binding protein n=1 Tax=Gordonia phage Mollymur TaxID=2590895 RepID=A0A4Y6EAL3_9CAUD|nr:transcriptional repressor [Gordonia phage Mollymur]QDF15457.1 helix-turn-helix DNA-binding protein [Gordonia phage Mollymur]
MMARMPTSEELAEPWHSALVDAGFVGPQGIPSVRQLAVAIDVHPSTLSRLIRGANARQPRPELVQKVAKALKRKPQEIAEWAGEQWESGLGSYDPPEGSETLTLRQRESVDRIIRAFMEVNSRQRARRAIDSKMVRELAKATNKTRVQIADILEQIEGSPEE